jgi:tetratricopeptide (TPR) repeat protein
MRRARLLPRRPLARAGAALLSALAALGLGAALATLSDHDICREAAGEVNTRILACSRILDDLQEPLAVRSLAARERAHAHYLRGDYDQAIADLTVALQFAPADAGLHIERGLAYEEKPDYDRAIADYTAAIRLAPEEGRAWHHRGRVHSARRQYEPAVADFTAALRAEPGWGFSYYLRARAYQELGRREDAIADYRSALAAARPYDEALVKAALGRLGGAP